ncbi:MAG: class I mannose-6-phosphate isomerase [Spirochaetales bacterium]|nr:class I mannose-6-phosphate isomerase [Spirochaetales bacterium]
MYPLLMSKVLKEKVWGGRVLDDLLKIPLAEGKIYGESWELSSHPNGPSAVVNGPWKGQTLPQLLEREGPKLLGPEVFFRFGGKFPLLIKYLDVHDRLSVQVHPSDAYAQEHEGEWGKSECWYVLRASPDARLILGLAEGISREVFQERVSQKKWKGLFREVSVHTGDFVQILPGTVHASVAGSVLLCEVQQNSDTTYRIWDFDRLEKGVPRPLHLDKALDVINFEARPVPKPALSRPWEVHEGVDWQPLVNDPLYAAALVHLTQGWRSPARASFRSYSLLEGSGKLTGAKKTWAVQAGQTWLVPAGVETEWEGNLTLLAAWS